MTGWLIILALTAATALALFRWSGATRACREMIGAALLLGLAGYAWQGSPGLPGSPAKVRATEMQPDSLFAEERGKLLGRFGSTAQWLNYADALHRMGQDRLAVTAMRSGIRENPRDPDLWVGLGNALILHGDGIISPAARLAFDRAARLAPDHPGPPYFLGLAYAQAGAADQAAETWGALLARSPADAPWRPEVQRRLDELKLGEGLALPQR